MNTRLDFLLKCLERLTVFSSAGRWFRFGTKSPFSVDTSICKYFLIARFFKVSKFALSHEAFKFFVLFFFLLFFYSFLYLLVSLALNQIRHSTYFTLDERIYVGF